MFNVHHKLMEKSQLYSLKKDELDEWRVTTNVEKSTLLLIFWDALFSTAEVLAKERP